VSWIKGLHDSGAIEFWFHGWDHGAHDAGGQMLCEFDGRPYEEQKARFERSQKLAMEKLGFAFETFGPPGGGKSGQGFDANTCRVMQDDPHMKAWLYNRPIDEPGKALAAQGKVAVLDRVWAVNLESAVGVPDFNRFVAGYAANADRAYFVLQGHPAAWAGGRFDEFVRIIDFLQAQKAVFMTPAECALHLARNSPVAK
jgi:peptidoglycan/xylan/chitin deacetylase (PgdA/CDA1 family)